MRRSGDFQPAAVSRPQRAVWLAAPASACRLSTAWSCWGRACSGAGAPAVLESRATSECPLRPGPAPRSAPQSRPAGATAAPLREVARTGSRGSVRAENTAALSAVTPEAPQDLGCLAPDVDSSSSCPWRSLGSNSASRRPAGQVCSTPHPHVPSPPASLLLYPARGLSPDNQEVFSPPGPNSAATCVPGAIFLGLHPPTAFLSHDVQTHPASVLHTVASPRAPAAGRHLSAQVAVTGAAAWAASTQQ